MNRSTKRWIIVGLLTLGGAALAFAGGSTEVPEADVATSGTQYLSPNGDGIQDSGTISFEVTIYVKSLEGYVPEYGIRLLDTEGEIIREIVERETSDLGWLRRLFRRYQAFTLEKSLSWDGLGADGAVVPDGEYAVRMWVLDEKGQRIELELDSFVIDVTPPSVDITLQSPAIFSPNGDGIYESYTITQERGTREDEWRGRIVDSRGNAVRSYTWTNAVPETIVWDGTGSSGSLVSDGTYRYFIETTDRSGNSFEYESAAFELVTVATPISIELDGEYISPNGDGVQDDLAIALRQETGDGILSWSLVVDDGRGNVVRSYGADGNPPQRILFDGLDDEGRPVRQGTWRALYRLFYRHGNEPFTSDTFVIDVTKPDIDVIVSNYIISPNGDGRQDETRITFRSSEPVSWSGEITDSRGRTIKATDSTRTTSLIVWDGTDSTGAVLPDGRFRLDARFTDLAGNTLVIPTEVIEIDTKPPVVTFEIDKDYFSPDGDGLKDTLSARFTANEPVRGLLTLADSAGRDVGTLGGLGRSYQFIEGALDYTWNGISGSGLYVGDGSYTVSSVFEDRAGNRITLAEKRFTIDTREVRLALTAPKGFSPNGDGKSDIVDIAVVAGFYDAVESWKIDFIDGYGKVMRSMTGADRLPRQFSWDGSMQFADASVKTPEGLYRARLTATYRKGNTVTAQSNQFFVDVTPPAVNLQTAADPFAQTNGTMEGDLFITMQIDDANEVADWSLDILTPAGEIIRSFTGRGDLQDQVVWKDDRKSVSRVPVTEQMVVRVGVVDEVGNFTTFEQSVPLDILVVKRDGKLYLMVPNVIFEAYRHELDSRGAEQYRKNLESIDRVVAIYNKYPDYRLLLEGHALNVFLGDAAKTAKEEEILVPLTERRAKTVETALVERGLDAEMVDTEWFGGTQPIVDVHDREVRWKNRRVEFIMERPKE
jgi:flagellar hook assembly protein FlgD